MVSALITGLAGAAHAFSLGYITTASVFRPDLSFDMIVHSLLGGIGTLSGPVLGAAIMTVLTQVVLGDLLQLHMMLTGAVIIALVFLLPGGLMGLWPRKGGSTVAADAGDIALAPLAAAPDGTSAAPILRLAGLTKQFRGLKAIDGLSIDIEPHRITAIIGPNGAGKSTLFNMISGYLAPSSGEIWHEASGSTASRPRISAGAASPAHSRLRGHSPA